MFSKIVFGLKMHAIQVKWSTAVRKEFQSKMTSGDKARGDFLHKTRPVGNYFEQK